MNSGLLGSGLKKVVGVYVDLKADSLMGDFIELLPHLPRNTGKGFS